MNYENLEEMNGLEKAALLLNVLGNQVTAQVFKRMKDNDVKRLVSAMGQVSKVPIPVVKGVLEEFYLEIAEEDTLIFGHAQGRDFVLATLGEERAKTVLGQLSVLEGSRTLEALELVDSRTLANFLVNEHPQTIMAITCGSRLQMNARVVLSQGPRLFDVLGSYSMGDIRPD